MNARRRAPRPAMAVGARGPRVLPAPLGAPPGGAGADARPSHRATAIALRDGWQLAQLGRGLAAGGAEISRPGFDDRRVGGDLGAVDGAGGAGARRRGPTDPYYGDNLEKIATEPFAVPWWYRTEFTVEEPLPAEARLVFEGINYSADVWLNGERIGGPRRRSPAPSASSSST